MSKKVSALVPRITRPVRCLERYEKYCAWAARSRVSVEWSKKVKAGAQIPDAGIGDLVDIWSSGFLVVGWFGGGFC